MPRRLTLLLSISSLLLFSLLSTSTFATAKDAPTPAATTDDDEDLSFLLAEDDDQSDIATKSHHDHGHGDEFFHGEDEDLDDFDDFDDPSGFDDEQQDNDEDDFFGKIDDKDVVVLTERNFSDVVEENKYVMVEFYAPWCGHCKAMAPEYAAAATELKSENVTLAKVDATEQNELAEEYEVQGFPTVYFFVDGEHKLYNGQRTKEAIVSWIRKKIGPAVKNVTTTEDAEGILTSGNKVVLAFLNSLLGPESEELAAASNLDDDVTYYQTVNPDVAKPFHMESSTKRPALVMLKREVEKLTFYDGEFTKSAISEFVSANKLPLVTPFTRENAPSIFDSPIKKQVLLFATSNDSDKIFPTFQEAAKVFKGKLIFVFVATDDEEDGRPVAEYFGITDAPKVLGYTGNDDAKKYFLDGEVTFEKIKVFGEDFLADKLKPFYKSDPIPETNDGDVKIVVGNNFDEIVLNDSKDVLLEIYAPWCGHCQALEPTYNKLAKHLSGIDSLVIAKMDGTTNEHPKAKVEGFPTILFFPAEEKNADPILVETERTVVALYKFLRKHASIPFKLQNPTSTSASESSGTKVVINGAATTTTTTEDDDERKDEL